MAAKLSDPNLNAPDLSSIKNKKILITGGGGFIGSWLTKTFIDKNNITILDNGRRNAFQYLPDQIKSQVKFIKADIQDLVEIKKAVNNQQIVLHLAAIAGASFYQKDPLLTLNVNLFGTSNLLQALVNSQIEQAILFSSSETYGANANNVSEEDPTCIGPISQGRWSYAISKLASDHLAMAYYKKYQLPVSIVRPFNVYGPRQVGEGAISNMILSAIRKKTITVTGDGSQKRSWCYIKDFIRAIQIILEKNIVGECFNLGNDQTYITILELAQIIQTLEKNVNINFIKQDNTDVIDRLPNIDKMKQLLNFTPAYDLEDGIRLSYLWYKENNRNV